MKKKNAKTAKKGRQLTAKQSKKIRGGMGVPVARRRALGMGDAAEGDEGMSRREGLSYGR